MDALAQLTNQAALMPRQDSLGLSALPPYPFLEKGQLREVSWLVKALESLAWTAVAENHKLHVLKGNNQTMTPPRNPSLGFAISLCKLVSTLLIAILSWVIESYFTFLRLPRRSL